MAQHEPNRVHKLAEWLQPLSNRYEDWLIKQGRIKEAYTLNKTIEELNNSYFYDWNLAPFEAKVACKRIWIDVFIRIVHGFGYPNLMDVGYANDL